jgi:hypothetical protein
MRMHFREYEPRPARGFRGLKARLLIGQRVEMFGRVGKIASLVGRPITAVVVRWDNATATTEELAKVLGAVSRDNS